MSTSKRAAEAALNFANSVYYNSSIKSIAETSVKGTADHTTQPSIPLNTAKPQMNVAAPEIVQPDRSANDTKVINVKLQEPSGIV